MRSQQLIVLDLRFKPEAPREPMVPLVEHAYHVRTLDEKLAFRHVYELGFVFGAQRREYWH